MISRFCASLVAAGLAGASLLVSPGAAEAQPATWNFEQADIPAAQPLGDYGKGVLVAVVDTWVDPTQPEFGGRVVDEADCLPGSCQDHSYAPDSCVHGTHVAGTIASADYGVAPQADILSVQVLSGPAGSPNASASCSGSTTTVAAGIDFAVSKGAKVINLSLGDAVPGLFQSSAITTAVTNAANRGVVVVFAAGNQGVPLTDSYGSDALIVAATGPSGQLASYSNFNTAVTGSVSVAAPGGDSGNGSCTTSTCVLSTFPDKQLGLLEGTSMAAPHVSGLAALLLAQDPARGVSGVFSAIEKTAKPLAGAGAGLIDAGKALQLEAGSHPAGPTSGNQPAGSDSTTPSTATPNLRPPASNGPATGTTSPSGGSRSVGTIVSGAASTPVVPSGGIAPSTTISSRASGEGRPVASGRAPTHPLRMAPSPWLQRHAVVLAAACIMLAGVVLDLLLQWRNSSRRLPGHP